MFNILKYVKNIYVRELIDQKYRILQSLGAGLSGQVYLVEGANKVRLALKELKPVQMGLAQDEAARRFRSEFGILKQLNHPGIARIVDYGWDAETERNYFTSEFIAGTPFFEYAEPKGYTQQEELFVQALRALEYLHAHHVQHLDIKSANILVTRQGKVKIIDFGLSTWSPTTISGTPATMAPEVIQGIKPDQRADLYSLAVLFYTVLTHRNPFQGKTLQETLERQKVFLPRAASSINRDVPAYMDSILENLLAKNRRERFANGALCLRALNLLSGKGYAIETEETLLSYLPEEGELIAREPVLVAANRLLDELERLSEKGWHRALWIQGEHGLGKSRLLREIKYTAQLRDFRVITEPSEIKRSPDQGKWVFCFDDADQWNNEQREQLLSSLQKAQRASILTIYASTPPGPDPLHFITTLIADHEVEGHYLTNYSKLDVQAYLTAVTGIQSPPDSLVSEIFKRTGGNPRFVVELLKVLIHSKRLFDDKGRWLAPTFNDLNIDFRNLTLSSALEGPFKKTFTEFSPALKEIISVLALIGQPVAEAIVHDCLSTQYPGDVVAEALQVGVLKREADQLTLHNPLWIDLLPRFISKQEQQRIHDLIAPIFEARADRRALVHRLQGTSANLACYALFELAEQLLNEGRSDDLISHLEFAIRSPHFKKAQRAPLLLLLAEAQFQEGQYPASLTVLEAIQESIKHEPSDYETMMKVFEQRAHTLLKMGRLEDAERCLNEGLALAVSHQDEIHYMILENTVGQLKCQQGDLNTALIFFNKNYAQWVLWDLSEKRQVLNNDLGFVYLQRKDYQEAVRVIHEQLPFYQNLGRKYFAARLHYNLAQAYQNLGRLDQAAQAYRDCLSLARGSRSLELMSRAYNGLGSLHHQKNEQDLAIQFYLRALALAERQNDASAQAALNTNLGLLLEEAQQLTRAAHHFTGAIELIRRIPDPSSYDLAYLARAELEMGSLCRLQNKLDQVAQHLAEAEQLIEKRTDLDHLKFWLVSERYQLAVATHDLETGRNLREQLEGLALSEEHRQHLRDVCKPMVPENPIPKPIEHDDREHEDREHADQSQAGWKGLIHILRFLNSEENLEFLFKSILRYAVDLSGAETAIVLLKDERGQLTIRADMSPRGGDELAQFSKTVAESVLSSGNALYTADATLDEALGQQQSIHIYQLKSILAVPIRTLNEVMGVLYLDTRMGKGFRTGIQELIQAFADQAALAVGKTRLLEEMAHTKDLLARELKKTQDELDVAKTVLAEESLHLKGKYAYAQIVTRSSRMREIFKVLDRVMDASLSIFIRGETGTGKELIAKALHYNSRRSGKEFVAINCASFPKDLMESELFGHVRGAFTGATSDKMGLVQMADNGTLFLDEVGEIPLDLQAKLLRFLQEREFRRVGENKVRNVDVRIVSATHRDLTDQIKQGLFREDLYYRLCQLAVEIPALRERREDIPLLAKKFMKDYQEQMGLKKAFKIEERLLHKMMIHHWPGNVRELQNFIQVACALSHDQVLSIKTIPPNSLLASPAAPWTEPVPEVRAISRSGDAYREDWKWEDYKKNYVALAYRHHNFKALDTAEALGISPPTLYKYIREWELDNPLNSVFQNGDWYEPHTNMAAWQRHIYLLVQNKLKKPYAAIRALGVSQGNFYKVVKA